jgi:predicted porin
MKNVKSLVALCMLGSTAGAANAQSSVTLYGLIDTGVLFITT